jgi:hypothetical protein
MTTTTPAPCSTTTPRRRTGLRGLAVLAATAAVLTGRHLAVAAILIPVLARSAGR